MPRFQRGCSVDTFAIPLPTGSELTSSISVAFPAESASGNPSDFGAYLLFCEAQTIIQGARVHLQLKCRKRERGASRPSIIDLVDPTSAFCSAVG
jgi:hypothetical protein